MLRVHVNENYDGVPQAEQTWHYPHVLHCLNVLRESVQCNADDTPMYTGRLHKNVFFPEGRAGIGTIKMCRDWSALMQWSHAHSACYKPVNWWSDPNFNEIERYKFCPDDSRPWEEVEKAKSTADLAASGI